MFICFVTSLVNISNGIEPKEKIYFYKDQKEVELYNKICCFIDIFNIDFTARKITNQLYSKIEDLVNRDSQLKNIFISSVQDLIKMLKPIINEFDIPLCNTEAFLISDFLKFIKLGIDNQNQTILESLLLLIDIESIFNFNEFIVFIDIKKYLTKKELMEIYKYSKYKSVDILLVESLSAGITLEYERKLIIDNGFDEFLLEDNP